MDQNSTVFRQKSLDNQNDNINLKKQIKIATPGVIMIIVGICIVAIGFIAWCMLYEIETTQKALLVKNNDGQTECIIRTDKATYAKMCKYKKVYLGEDEYNLNIDDNCTNYNFLNLAGDSNETDDYITNGIIEQELNYKTGDKYYSCTVDGLELSSHSGIGDVVIKKDTPIDYLLDYSWYEDNELYQ